MGIEASASPPRLPLNDRMPPLKGLASTSRSSSLQPSASPPMPQPFFPAPQPQRHKRSGSDGSRPGGGGGSPEGASPKAGAKRSASGLSLLDDDDVCPTCLDAYTGGTQQGRRRGRPRCLVQLRGRPCAAGPAPHLSPSPSAEDNPKMVTSCGHHFHLPCLYEWLERSQTCPVCSADMRWEEVT